MDIYQSPYTPADLVLMAKEKETLEWDRTCRLIEMLHNTHVEKPMRFNAAHPYRQVGARPKEKIQLVSAGEFCKEMKGGSYGNNSGSGNRRGKPRH